MTELARPPHRRVPRRRALVCAAIGALSLTLAACQTVSIARPGARPAVQSGLSGNWASSDGVFTAQFTPGRFVSTAVGSEGQPVILAQGSVSPTGPRTVRLDWFSQQNRTAVSADCVRSGRNVLDCTPSAGTPFRLLQQSA